MTIKILSRTEQQLLDSGGLAFDASALPAAGAARKSEIVSFGEPAMSREGGLGLSLQYVAKSDGTNGRAHVRVWVSAADDQPSSADGGTAGSSWRKIAITDGTVTNDTAFAGGGAVNGQVDVEGDLIRTKPRSSSGVEAVMVPLRLDFARWIYVEAAEIGDTAHPGTLTVGLVRA